MTMLCGACPGWICYAEKTHGEVLPLISTTKSSQQIMGYLIKTEFAQKNNIPLKDLYHVTVMSCYDKKLEASRNTTLMEDQQNREVDCVLASSEILKLIMDQHINFEALPETPLIQLQYLNIDANGELCGMQGGTSGGYLEFIFHYAAMKIWNKTVDTINYTTVRNDHIEISLEINGQKVLKFARVNGFRHIQNIVRRIKQKTCEYDFIEIMACPGGCTNGGGQIREDTNNPTEAKKLLSKVNDIYNQRVMKNPTEKPDTKTLHQFLSNSKKLHTTFKAVPKLEYSNPLTITW